MSHAALVAGGTECIGSHDCRKLAGNGLEPVSPDQDILVVNINKYLNTWSEQSASKMDVNGFLDLMAATINQLSQTVQAPLLLVGIYHGDIELTAELRKRLKVPQQIAAIDNKEYDHYQIKEVLSKVSLLLKGHDRRRLRGGTRRPRRLSS